MTRQGSFKRAVRRHARETGQRYTEARAALDKGTRDDTLAWLERLGLPNHRPFEPSALKAHLEDRYGIRITSMSIINEHQPSLLRIDHQSGPPWVARVFSSPADQMARVEGDAEILRFLASHDFPAELLAHDQSISLLDGHGVLVTEFVSGGVPKPTAVSQGEMAGLLCRLHTLPPAGGAVARDGGSLDHNPHFVGRPRVDLAAAMSHLVSVEDAVDPKGRATFEWLRDQVENADDGEGLPEALTHGNYVLSHAIGKPGNLVIVGWGGSGRGPRLPALAWQMTCTFAEGAARPDSIAAIARAYREHVQLTDDELERLPGVLQMRVLTMACFEYRAHVHNGHTPTLQEPGWLSATNPADLERLAAQAIAVFRS